VDYVGKHLPGVNVVPPEGTYMAWLDCGKAGLPKGSSAYSFFLEQARVALNPGESFGKGQEHCVRLNFGCPRPLLREALKRMRKALEAARR
jgi:cystathionine beta-lyase